MIERFCSKDYKGRFTAICDAIYLPFWGIDEVFASQNALPFVLYFNHYGRPKLLIGNKGDGHYDIFEDNMMDGVDRYDTLCGRVWLEQPYNILTVWCDCRSEMLSYDKFSIIANAFYEKEGIDIYNAKLVFEDDCEDEPFSFRHDDQTYYIYSISVEDYILLKMKSFKSVINEYNEKENKNKKFRSAPAGKWSEWDYKNQGVGYLGYHLMTRQDENKNSINEEVLENSPDDSIRNEIVNNETSLSNNQAIPDIYNIPFLVKLANDGFDRAKNALYNIGRIDDINSSDLKSGFNELVSRCMELERPYRNELEKICINIVIDLFSIPNDSVELCAKLVDTVDLDNNSIILDPVDGYDDFELDDLEETKSIRSEVSKRRLLDALCMGASITMSSDVNLYKSELDRINPKLCDLYNKIISLNNYLLYTGGDNNMTDENKMQIGTVNLTIGQEDEKPRITSQGTIFPVLLSETIRGLFELFISHGLPEDKKTAEFVLRKSDYLKAEPHDMRFGPGLWNLLINSFNDSTDNDIPYIIKRISCLDIDKFNILFNEVFAKTKKGRRIMSKICSNAKRDKEYDKFTCKMDKLKSRKSVITDEYINEDEL